MSDPDFTATLHGKIDCCPLKAIPLGKHQIDWHFRHGDKYGRQAVNDNKKNNMKA